MFVYASYLYYHEDYSIWTDEAFDAHCKFLLDHYDKLPVDITSRVTREHLQTGSGFDLEFAPSDITKAHQWREYVEALRPCDRDVLRKIHT